MEKLNRETADKITDLYNKLDSLESEQRFLENFSCIWFEVFAAGHRRKVNISNYFSRKELAAIALTNIEIEIKKVKESLTALGAKI